MSGEDERRSGAGGSEDGGDHTGHRRRWLVTAGLVVAAYAVGLVVVGVRDAVDALAQAALAPLAAALLLEAGMVLLWPMVHRSSVAAVGHRIRYRDALNISMTAWTLSQSLPGGGAVGGAEAVRRLTKLGLPGPVATASITLTGSLSLMTVALIGAGGVAVGFLTADLPGIAAVAAAAAVLALLGFVVGFMALLHSRRNADRLLDWLQRRSERLAERVDRWRSSVHDVTDDPPRTRQLLVIVAWCAVKWSCDLGALALIFVALDQPLRPTTLVVAFGVSQLGAAVPVTPGGLGFVEGGMVGALLTFGVPLSLATTAVLLYRVVATWLPALAGVPALLRRSEPDDDADETDEREEETSSDERAHDEN